MTPLKVAMIGWEFPPFMAGGLGIHCLELTTQLVKMGAEIDFYMPHMTTLEGPMRVRDHHKHINIIEVEADPGLSPYGAQQAAEGGAAITRFSDVKRAYKENFNEAVHEYNERVKEAFDPSGVDVVHAHDWITVDSALHARHAHDLPVVWTCHSTEYDRSAGFYPQEWIVEKERSAVHGADAVIAVSGYTKSEVVRRFAGDPAKIFPVYNGVDFSKFADHMDRDYGRPTKNVLFLSRLTRQKGPMFFIQAARKVLDKVPDARFIVAGKGDALPGMIEYCLEHHMMDNVSFAGFVPDDEMIKLYEQCDVYVLPSVSEPFGISILEAMTSGTPTIVSKTTGVGEALSHVLKADYWDTHEMADMIIRLLESRPLRANLGRNGALESRRFTWDRCARRTLAVYNHLIASRNPGAVLPPPPHEGAMTSAPTPLTTPGGSL